MNFLINKNFSYCKLFFSYKYVLWGSVRLLKYWRRSLQKVNENLHHVSPQTELEKKHYELSNYKHKIETFQENIN